MGVFLKSLSAAYAAKSRRLMAKGGVADGDMVDRIMEKRRCMSEGGMVANDTSEQVDELPNEFDDLVLDDDLSGEQPEDSNMDGNRAEASDREDMISKIMAARKKRDRNPNPA